MRMSSRLTLWSLPVLSLFGTVLQGADPSAGWTRFRGPNGGGVALNSTAPLPWQESDIRWKAELPGEGNGSAVVWGDKYFVLSADPKTAERHVLCGNMANGAVVWKKSYPSQKYSLHKLSSYASSTPCVDEKHVYFIWAEPEHVLVKAFKHDGTEVWTRDLGRYVSQHGFGTSPIRVDDLLIFANSQDAEELPAGVAPGEDHLVALEASTGKTRWQTPRKATRVCYGVPCVAKGADGKSILFSANTGDGFSAVDAETGKVIWSRSGFKKRICSSTVLAGDVLISTEGSGGGGNVLIATEAKPDGKELYRITRAAPYVPTPVVVGDLVFLWADNGIVSCVELKSGETVWSQRVGGNVSSSPIVVRDRLLAVSQEGVVTILSASREFKELGEIPLNQICRSTPAATDDAILIRTASQLLCIGKP